MSAPNLYPLNDLTFEVTLKHTDTDPESATFGKNVPTTSGTVTTFLVTDPPLPTSTAADPTLTGTCTHIANGRWLVAFDASVLQPALLATLFASTTPWAIVQSSNNVRVAVELAYSATRTVEVEA